MNERTHGRITILELHGNLSGGPEADSFRKRHIQLVEGGAIYQILNLEHVKLIASHGVGMMIGARKRCAEAGGRLVACEPSKRQRSLFNLYQIQRIIDVYQTEAEAIASIGVEAEMHATEG
jgi:anti-anti-sigma factor